MNGKVRKIWSSITQISTKLGKNTALTSVYKIAKCGLNRFNSGQMARFERYGHLATWDSRGKTDPQKMSPLDCPQTGGVTTLKLGGRVKVIEIYEVTTFDLFKSRGHRNNRGQSFDSLTPYPPEGGSWGVMTS